MIDKKRIELKNTTEVLLITGIANPVPLKKLLEKYSKTYHMIEYSDHHIFTIDDLHDIQDRYKAIESAEKIILTTEKDAVRLDKFGIELEGMPVYVIPIRHHFLFDEREKFNTRVGSFIENFKTNN